ncbi:hypothetical protein D3C84_1239510 [compost metagenome]
MPREGLPPQKQIACPIRFSAGLPEPRHTGGAVGSHTADVLAELGLSTERIEALMAAKVVG